MPNPTFALINRSTFIGNNAARPRFGQRIMDDNDMRVIAKAINEQIEEVLVGWRTAPNARCIFLKDESRLQNNPDLWPIYVTDTYPYTIPGFTGRAGHGVTYGTARPYHLNPVTFPYQMPGRPFGWISTRSSSGLTWSHPWDQSDPLNPVASFCITSALIGHEVIETLMNPFLNGFIIGPTMLSVLAFQFNDANGLAVFSTDGSPFRVRTWLLEVVDPVLSSRYNKVVSLGGVNYPITMTDFTYESYWDVGFELARLGVAGYDPAPVGTKFDHLGLLPHGFAPLAPSSTGAYQIMGLWPTSVQGPAMAGAFPPAYAASAAFATGIGLPPAPTSPGNVRVQFPETYDLVGIQGLGAPPFSPQLPATLESYRTPGNAATSDDQNRSPLTVLSEINKIESCGTAFYALAKRQMDALIQK